MGMCHRISGPMPDLCARGVLTKIVVTVPVLRRSDRARHEATPTIGTHVAQDSVDTCGAKGTLIGTDAGFQGVRGQWGIAMFTGRA